MTMRILFTTVVVCGLTVVPSTQRADSALQTPASLRAEHDAIHAELEDATHAPGRIGAAAQELAKVLHPHFVREQEIALPPLGLLASLAAGKRPADSGAVLQMTDTLKQELPKMLEEHTRIRAAVDKLREAAKAGRAGKYERLADDLAHHAQTEEEVLYPAAILVGDIVRGHAKAK